MESFHSRARWIVSALPVLMIFFLSGFASAQGLFGMGLPGLPSLGGTSCGAVPYGGLVISADAKAGYGHIGLNFSLPGPSLDSIDLAFRDANVWVGSVEARVDSCSGFFLALKGEGNASRNNKYRHNSRPEFRNPLGWLEAPVVGA